MADLVRHGRQRRASIGRSVIGGIALALAVVLVSGGSVAAIAAWHLSSTITANAVDIGDKGAAPPPSLGDFRGPIDIVVVAVDNDPTQNAAVYGQRHGATLNDVNMLVHVSADHRSATVVSFPRDLVIPGPACTSEDGKHTSSAVSAQPLNTAYSRGGLKCVVDTIEQASGIEVPYAGLITFDGVVALATAVGGADVCVTGPIHDRASGLVIPAAGTYTLTGTQAAQFLRTREKVADGSDLGRISSQQVFMSALLRKLQSQGTLNDLGKLYGIAGAAAQHMRLSTSLAHLDTMVSMARTLRLLSPAHTTFVQYPGSTGGTGVYASKVRPDLATAAKLFASIKADQPVGLDAHALGGAFGQQLAPGSTGTPAPPASGAPTASGSPSPSGSAPPPTTIDGVHGQTAAQQTCVQAR